MAEVIVRSVKGLANEIIAGTQGQHRLPSDEPLDAGGTDTGPSPYELLLAALGACTSMTLHLYAGRKQWPLEGVEVALAHDRIHAADCATCDSKVARIDRIRARITLRGPLDEAQRARLMEIAARCPVYRTLTGTIHIEEDLVPPPAPPGT